MRFINEWDEPPTFRFGKYKHERITDVRLDYLGWVLDNVEDLEPSERRCLIEEVERRGARYTAPGGRKDRESSRHDRSSRDGGTASPWGGLPKGVTPAIILQIIAAGRQTLAKRHHPDAGGDAEAMKLFNMGADFLEKQARALPGGSTR